MLNPNQDPIADAVLSLLQTVPDNWSEYDSESLNEPKEHARELLVDAGLLELRFNLRLRMFGHPKVVEATCRTTGELGINEVGVKVEACAREIWRDEWDSRQKWGRDRTNPFHCERFGKEQWRLTTEGINARLDLGDPKNCVLDFVLRRGIFDGQIRSGLHGRPIHRKTVRGRGIVEKIASVSLNRRVVRSGPAKVGISNWNEGAVSFVDAFKEMIASSPAKTDRSEPTIDHSNPANEIAFHARKNGKPRRPKRSTQKGEARDKIISAFSLHHNYGFEGEIITHPIGSNELARNANVGTSTTSRFFEDIFGGYPGYRRICYRDPHKLQQTLERLNGETPSNHRPLDNNNRQNHR